MRFSPGAQLLQPPAAAPIALGSWDGATMLQSLLDAGLGGYDDFALATPSQYVAAVPEVAAKPVPPVLPVPLMDDEINRALPPLATLQRSDTLWGEVLSYLDTVTDHQAPSGSNRRFPLDPATAETPLGTITLLELASLCFVDPSGVLRRHRVAVRGHHGVRIHAEPTDRGVICVPRALRLVVLSLYHSDHQHTGSGWLLDTLDKEFWWPTIGSDATKFIDQCHICNSMKASRQSKDDVRGKFPSLQVTMDVRGKFPTTPEGWCYLRVLCMLDVLRASRWVGAIPMKGNSTQDMLEAC